MRRKLTSLTRHKAPAPSHYGASLERQARQLPKAVALLGAMVLLLAFASSASASIQVASTWGSIGQGEGQFQGTAGGIATDSSGNVYVGDPGNHRIEKFSSSGVFISAWGWGVSDGASHYEICTSSCQAGIGGASADQFNQPAGIATDSLDNVYVVDGANNRIQKFSSSGAFISTWGSSGSGDGQLLSPSDLATDSSNNVYVTDHGNNRIDKFSSSGTFISAWGWGVDDGQQLYEVCTSSCRAGVAEDRLSGGYEYVSGVGTDGSNNVYVVDYVDDQTLYEYWDAPYRRIPVCAPCYYTNPYTQLEKFSSSGDLIESSFGGISDPNDAATDSSNHVYVAGGSQITEFDPSGASLTESGYFGTISRIAHDASSNIYATGGGQVYRLIHAPQSQIDSGPQLTNNPTPTFKFSADNPTSRFACRLDSNQEADFQPCTSPKTIGPMTDGHHTFDVRATDSSGVTDPSPASRTFTVDTTPPQTTITGGPNGVINHRSAKFTFSSSETGSTFACKLDSGSYGGCTSPKTFSGLTEGAHTLYVRAKDRAGNFDPTPATRTFSVRTASVGISGTTLVVTAAPGANDNLQVTRPSSSVLRVTDLPSGPYSGSAVRTVGPGCALSGESTANCHGEIALVQVSAGDQIDQVVNSTSVPSSLSGEDGADTLIGGPARDTLTGGPGADTLKGMNGNDQLFAQDGASDKLINCDGGIGAPGGADKADLDALPLDPDSIVQGCESKTRH